MSYLKLEKLQKVYNNKVEAVKSIDLEVNKGEFLVLLGPSGCGKTTTMRMVAGLEDVTNGDIVVDGKSIKNLSPKDRHVSMIFQSYAVWPHMTVYENIAYALKLKKMKKDEIKAVVEEVAEVSNIKQYLDRYPSQLSGGQRQRVAVARAIAVKPKLFLMDEPLSNLDAKLRDSMRTELRKIHNRLGATSIFVTHDQAEAMSLADRIVVMRDGEIEQIGTPYEVYHESESIFVANFIGTPPTNFIDINVVEESNQLLCKAEGFNFIISKDDEGALRDYSGQEVILGVRPENFEIVEDGEYFTLNVDLIEPQGSHSIILSNFMGKDIRIVTDKIHIKENDQIKIRFKEGSCRFFDKDSERRIMRAETV